jgi:hypothetical protein
VRTRDRALADSVLAEDFELVLAHPTPAAMPRARWLEVLDDYLISRWDVGEIQSRIVGDVAVAHFVVMQEAVVLGQDRSGLFAITDVWRGSPDGWRVAKRFSTPMSAGVMPGT